MIEEFNKLIDFIEFLFEKKIELKLNIYKRR